MTRQESYKTNWIADRHLNNHSTAHTPNIVARWKPDKSKFPLRDDSQIALFPLEHVGYCVIALLL
jgi:hypothetical protein